MATLTPDQQKETLIKAGEHVFKTGGKGGIACTTCHGENGQGTPGAFPSLVGSKEWMGDCKHHAGIVINGLPGGLPVKGVNYPSAMPPQGTLLTDFEIAAAITYERNSWGNDFGICLPADVAAARKLPAPTGPGTPEAAPKKK
jgi:cytochrome c oxidase subunit 2